MTAVRPRRAASLRMFMRVSLLLMTSVVVGVDVCATACFRRVGYIVRQTPFMPVAGSRRRLPRWTVGGSPRQAARQVEAWSRRPNQAAGSASSGSNASSAAPTSGASTPSVAGTTRTSARGRRQRAPVELRLDASRDERIDPAEQAAEDHEPRVEDVDEAGQPDAQPAADLRRGPRRAWRRRPRPRARTRVDARRGRRRRDGRRSAQQRALADLGLPAADRAAAARRRRPG